MGSSSNRKSGSSARSTARRRVHVGTGTRSRTASEKPHTQVDASTDQAARAARTSGRSRDDGRPRGRQRESEAARIRREQREAKRTQQRRIVRLRAAVAVGVIVAVVLITSAVYRSRLFAIEAVEVTGVRMLTEESIRSRVILPEGATLLRFPSAQIEADLEADPWIGGVSLSRRLPSTLAVDIEERVPVALVDVGTVFWFVDAEGRFLGESSLESTDSVLPMIRDVPGLVPTAGALSEDGALINALQVLQGVSPELAALVRAVSAASAHETTLITEASVEVMVGEAVQLTEKSALALGIMAEQGADVVFIDVRSIDRPISRGLGR